MTQILQWLGVESQRFFFFVLVDVLSVFHYLRDRFRAHLLFWTRPFPHHRCLLKNLQVAHCENYRHISSYGCQTSAFLWLLLQHGAFSLWFRRVEKVKRFVNVNLHCIISNLTRISKMLTLLPWKISADAHVSPIKYWSTNVKFNKEVSIRHKRKSTVEVILLLGESNRLDWSRDNLSVVLGLA